MGGIWIFGGTSEGRRLAAFCEENGFPAAVSVATEYGEQAQAPLENGCGKIMRGRLGETQMREYLKAGDVDLVIDATHPYAVEVTENIRNACGAEAVEYIRLLRRCAGNTAADGMVSAASAREAADFLAGTEGAIFLTTGSKDLPVFCERLDMQRLYPRVLPSVESLELCKANGIPQANCIAMQGPFSETLNLGLLLQYRCRYLVTKESGAAGGYEEKIAACQKAGVTAVVIRRPAEENGLEFEQVCSYLHHKFGRRDNRQEIDIVGIGLGTEGTMTEDAIRTVRQAEVLIGGKRMLEQYQDTGRLLFYCYQAEEIRRFIDRLGEKEPSSWRIAILMSGDVGFYSGARRLLDALKGYRVRLHPGIPSVAYMAAKIGVPWQDMALCSVHGRKQNVLAKIRHHETVFALAGKDGEIGEVCRQLVRSGMDEVEVFVGENLSYANERIWHGSPGECLKETFESLLAAVFLNRGYRKPAGVLGIPDQAFVRGDVPMTKEEIRAISITKLRLTRDAIVYDVGAGTGSVSIEAALAAEDGMVYSIEKRDEAADLIEENARKFGVTNLSVIRGTAPDVLAGLPMPTHAFIGGSSGNLKEIIAVLLDKNPEIRIVINAISLETIAEMAELSVSYEMELAMVTVARAKPAGNYQLMKGQNPVMIGTMKGR